jgi:hypothetical protein
LSLGEGIVVTRTLLRSLVVATGVAALITGCGTPEAGSAAIVGGRRITVSQVQSATVDVQTLFGPQVPVAQRQVLYLLAAAPYIEQAAIRYKVGVSTDDARSVLAERVANPSASGIEVIQANIALTQLQQSGQDQATQVLAEVAKDLKQDGFMVSPRYGSFDPQHGGITELQPNWLIGTQTASPSATP